MDSLWFCAVYRRALHMNHILPLCTEPTLGVSHSDCGHWFTDHGISLNSKDIMPCPVKLSRTNTLKFCLNFLMHRKNTMHSRWRCMHGQIWVLCVFTSLNTLCHFYGLFQASYIYLLSLTHLRWHFHLRLWHI